VTDLSRLTETLTEEVLKRLRSLESSGGGMPAPAGDGPSPGVTIACVGSACTIVRAMVDDGASRVTCALGCREIESDLAEYIDHTLLRPDATEAEVRTLCEEAVRYGFASVCVNPYWASFAAGLLRGCKVPVCTVAGFPLGATSTAAKAFEADDAVRAGAEEIDMVINVGEIKGKNYAAAERDIEGVVGAASGRTVKVIIETALLTDEEKVTACVIARQAGADFVKTSTGFAKAGATAEDVRLMRRVVGPEVRIKAAGGIRDEAAARSLIAAGADRLGASASVKIVGSGR